MGQASMYERYFDQVRLLLSVLPDIAREDAFALKGGTAINLFYRDIPRLSVDIDLTYLPVHDRERSLKDIDETLDRIMVAITDRYPRVQAGTAMIDCQYPPDIQCRGFAVQRLADTLQDGEGIDG